MGQCSRSLRAQVYDTDLVKKDTTNPEIREVVRKLGQAGIAQSARRDPAPRLDSGRGPCTADSA